MLMFFASIFFHKGNTEGSQNCFSTKKVRYTRSTYTWTNARIVYENACLFSVKLFLTCAILYRSLLWHAEIRLVFYYRLKIPSFRHVLST